MEKGLEKVFERLKELEKKYAIEEYFIEEFDGLYWDRCISLEVYTSETEEVLSFCWVLASGEEI